MTLLVRLALAAGLLAAGPLLLVAAPSRAGRLLGAATALLWLAAAALALGAPAAGLACLGLTGLNVALLLGTGPPPVAAPGGGLASVARGRPLRRWQMRLTPEADLIALGAAIISRIDLRVSRAHRRRLRAGVRELLDGMNRHPEYARLAPAFPHTLWGPPADTRHALTYVPPDARGLLVALHGHGGNAALWLHAWRDFADAHGYAVLAPSFGYGNWDHPAAAAAVRDAVAWALAEHALDPARVVLAGISQGGCGVLRAAAADPGRYAALVGLSPTLEPAVAADPAVRGARAWIAHGTADANVTAASVDRGVAALRSAGAEVEVWTAQGEDHFLFFARRAEAFERLAAWLNSSRPA